MIRNNPYVFRYFLFALCAHAHRNGYDNTVTFALKMAMLTSQINVSPRFCEQCCSYQHKKTGGNVHLHRRRRQLRSCCIVVSKRVDENKDKYQKFTATGELFWSPQLLLSASMIVQRFVVVVTVRGRDRRPSSTTTIHKKKIRKFTPSARVICSKCPAVLRVGLHDAGIQQGIE